jgi:hypothetical protein
VVSGALWGTEFLSDVASAILLVVTSVCFTSVILGFEKKREREIQPRQTYIAHHFSKTWSSHNES